MKTTSTIFMSKHYAILWVMLMTSIQLAGQNGFYPSDQKVFVNGAFSDLNAAWMGRWDGLSVGVEWSQDWSGFEGNPRTGMGFFDTRIGEGNSFVGATLKFDRIAAFNRSQIGFGYAYSGTLSENNGFKPIRLVLGFQPHLDFFKADYTDVLDALYPAAVPPDGINQTTFGFNVGVLLTNGGYDDQHENTWYLGASRRNTGISLSGGLDETETDLSYQEWLLMAGIRQNINYEDLYFESNAHAIQSPAGVDLSLLLSLEKNDLSEGGNGGGWFALGVKSNAQTFEGAKQFVLQLGLIKRLFEGQDNFMRIGFFAETDLGPFSLLGNRFGLMMTYRK